MFKQKHDCDCALASVANLKGVDQQFFIPARLIDKVKEQGTSYHGDVIRALRAAGFRAKDYKIIDPRCVSETVETLLWGRRALLSVPSLNYKGGLHMVYWDGDNILDPSTKRTYKQLNKTYIQSMFLFK